MAAGLRENVDGRDLAHSVSRGSKDLNSNWARGHLCAILAKNLAAFRPCPKNLGEAKLKSNECQSFT